QDLCGLVIPTPAPGALQIAEEVRPGLRDEPGRQVDHIDMHITMAVRIAGRMLVLMARYAVHDRFSSCHASSERRSGAAATIASAVCTDSRLALPRHRSFCAPS